MVYAWDIVTRLRPTIFVAALSIIVLAGPEQILELYLINIDALAHRTTPLVLVLASYTVGTAFLFVAIIVLWVGSNRLLMLEPGIGASSRGKQAAANVLVVLIAIAPLLGLLAGLRNARAELPRIALSDIGDLTDVVGICIAGWTLVTAATAAALAFALYMRAGSLPVAEWLFSCRAIIGAVGLVLAFTFALLIAPALPAALGTLTVLFIFFSTLSYALAVLSQTYRATGIPVTVILIACAVVFSLRGWNDNHKVDHQSGTRSTALEQGFTEWYAARKDRDYFANKKLPYPVYIFAAEGGGVYAGYNLASFLARMQEHCPVFAQHLFAISSVSGGSLGAAHFAAQATKHVTNAPWQPCQQKLAPGPLASEASRFFENDFLAPLVAATLFPDLIQRVLPMRIGSFDRARWLERAYTSAWATENQGSKNPFDMTLDDLWMADGATPALFLNTTNVHNGARITLSSLVFDTTATATHVSKAFCAQNSQPLTLRLASAVALSARFPWVTPAGWLERSAAWSNDCGPSTSATAKGEKPSGHNRLYLADGGYFENSGLEMATELVGRLRRFADNCHKQSSPEWKGERDERCGTAFDQPVDIRIVMVFTMDEFFLRMLGEDTELAEGSPGELYTPLKTLLNTRVARTRAVHAREWLFDEAFNVKGLDTFYAIPDSPLRYGAKGMHQVMLDGTKTFVPLGWRLSKRSVANIANNSDGSAVISAELIRRELMGEPVDDLMRR